MRKVNDLGLFGKLPAHGDFIYRDLPSHFISAWDAWLQGFIASSQQQLGEAWLDTYLTSPIWRFVISDGVVDGHAWLGIMLPSVDRVGRYFPFSIVAKAPASLNPFLAIEQYAWFEAIEQLALSALSGTTQLDDLAQHIKSQPLILPPAIARHAISAEALGTVVDFSRDAPDLGMAYPHLMDNHCRQNYSNYSLWSTANGSEKINPCLFYSRGLPSFRASAALLDGQWSQWGWHQPIQALL
ncbi:MAG: type VI secretion system-associated protein TagF [Marinagarivorans sp.]|nr:type VI secretion system-associated protein TagF [Marinagarivorans sp.]